MTRFDEFPSELSGLSIHQCFDASNECEHGNLPFDGVICGCFVMGFRVSDSDKAVELLRSYAEREGRAPTRREWAKVAPHGFGPQRLGRLFGSWTDAVRAAGLEPRRVVGAPLAERFWANVEKTDLCWRWTAHLDRKTGYGRLLVDGGMVGAHRIAYQLLVGPIPEGLDLDHLCRNKACVNPDHLEPVTQQENIRRGKSAKVTWRRAREIRESSESNVAIATRLGISDSVVSRIRSGKAWMEDQKPREAIRLPDKREWRSAA